MSLLFQCGVLSSLEVIAWADSEIIKADLPGGALLELTTTESSKTEDILSHLRRLSAGADFWQAFRHVLCSLYRYVVSNPDKAETIANHLFLAACEFSVADVPDDLRFVYRFDDAFSLAREGTYGDFETVYREFVAELERFTKETS